MDPTLLPLTFGFAFVVMLVIVFIAGIIRGFTGFGSALLAVPALAMLYGPAQAVVIEVLIEIPVTLGLLPTAVREADRKTVLPILAMFVIFVPLGALMLSLANPDYVKIGIGLFVLFSVLLMTQHHKIAGLFTPKSSYIVGALSGTTQGLTGMGGPLFATALIARNDPNARTRANIAAVAGGIIILSVVSFAIVGLITAPVLISAALACPAILLGVWTGTILFRSHSHRNLRGLLMGLLVAIAVVTLWDSTF